MRPQAEGQAPSPAPDPAAGPILLPPRPNLGPEPWRDAPGPSPFWFVAAVLLLLMVLAAIFRSRRRRRRKADASATASGTVRPAEGRAPDDPRVVRAEALRDALIATFGPAWGAKTTEEIAADAALADRIGGDRAARVVALLAEADEAKFAGDFAREPRDQEQADRILAGMVEALAAPPSRGPTT